MSCSLHTGSLLQVRFLSHLFLALCTLIKQKYLKEPDSISSASLQDSDILSLGVSSHRSWWKDNGPGCESHGLPAAGWQEPQNPELTTVVSCWLEYQYIEILHSIVQLLVSVSLCRCLSHISWLIKQH